MNPGPGMGRLLEQVLEQQVCGHIKTQADAFAWVRSEH